MRFSMCSLPADTWRHGRSAVARVLAPACVAIAAVLLGGCTTVVDDRRLAQRIAPLQLGDRSVAVADALSGPPLGLLELNDEMKAFVQQTTEGYHNERARLQALHNAIKDDKGLDMRYDPFADGNAQDVFERRTANCLSYAHMFVALAREANLDAHYQWMEVRPEWQRIGERVAVRLHVNVQIKTRDGEQFMVDIDPLQRSEVAGARLMSDEEGIALAHNNLAMVALSEDRPEEAWRSLVRGLAVAPGLSQLWVNLGAIYRYTGQLDDAERAYNVALRVNPVDRSAMNNLVVLYEQMERYGEAERWLARLRRYRDRNPYYHESLGEEALAAGDLVAAYEHYREAWRLQPEDGRLAYSLGLMESERGNLKAAEKLLRQAVEKAAFTGEKQRYAVTLRRIREEMATL
jgi:Flp pilus assembly protein TadD